MIQLDDRIRFISIGAQRCGTTSLFFYLSQHPEIYMSNIKETNFFSIISDDIPDRMFSLPIIDEKPKTTNEYKNLFRDHNNERAFGEVTPLYLYHSDTPRTIKKYIPDVKLIVSLRNPVERAWSAFQFDRDGKREDETDIRIAIEKQQRILENTEHWWQFVEQAGVQTPYLEGGLYYQQLKRYMDIFPEDQIYVYLFDDFIQNPEEILTNIFKFIGVENTNHPEEYTQHNDKHIYTKGKVFDRLGWLSTTFPNVRNFVPHFIRRGILNALLTTTVEVQKQTLDKPTRVWLLSQYVDDINNLEVLINRDLSLWKTTR